MGILDVFFNRSKQKVQDPEPPSERQYLFVPEKDRSKVIALGGGMREDAHVFYKPEGFDPAPFAEWATPQLVRRPERISEEQKAAFEPELTVIRQRLQGTLLSDDPALIDHLVETERQKLYRNEEEKRDMQKIYAMKKGEIKPMPNLGFDRVYDGIKVKVPYRDVERAQEAGITWNRNTQQHTIPEGKDLESFAEWVVSSPTLDPVAMSPSVSPQAEPSSAPIPTPAPAPVSDLEPAPDQGREAVLTQESHPAFESVPVAENDRVVAFPPRAPSVSLNADPVRSPVAHSQERVPPKDNGSGGVTPGIGPAKNGRRAQL